MPPEEKRAATSRHRRRGRPSKFGRPSQMIALTLPEDILGALATVHRDPGWAIVRLVEKLLGEGAPHRPPKSPVAELVQLPGSRAIIVVQPQIFGRMRGIAMIPLSDGRAFLAFDQTAGLADLEVAILDQLDAGPSAQRSELLKARDIVRAWRQDTGLVFRSRSILVGEQLRVAAHQLLPTFDGDARGGPSARGARRRRSKNR